MLFFDPHVKRRSQNCVESFNNKEVFKRRECVVDHTIIIHYKSAEFLQCFCKNQSSVMPYLLIVYCRSASSLS